MAAQDVHRPLFTQTPIIGFGALSVANTNLDGSTGTYVTILTGASPNGSLIAYIRVKGTGTTTTGRVRFFIDNGGGAVNFWTEMAITAAVPSATVSAFEGSIDYSNIPVVLPSGYILKACPTQAETFDVTVLGGTYTEL